MLLNWSIALMGVHLGLHFGIITAKLKNRAAKLAACLVMTGISVCGFYLFFKANYFDYMLLKNPFAFLDYDKAWWLVILENLAMLLAWAFAGFLFSLFLRGIVKKGKKKAALLFAALLAGVIGGAVVLNTALNARQTNPTAAWSTAQNSTTQDRPAFQAAPPAFEASE